MTFLENASPQVYILSIYTKFRPGWRQQKKYFVILPSPTPAGLDSGLALYIYVIALRTSVIGFAVACCYAMHMRY